MKARTKSILTPDAIVVDTVAIKQKLLEFLNEKSAGELEVLATDTPAHDAGDSAESAAQKETAAFRLTQISARNVQSRAAIRRIDAGTYGICTNCEEPIHPKRIIAIPWTSLCIGCQELRDKGQLEEFNAVGTQYVLRHNGGAVIQQPTVED